MGAALPLLASLLALLSPTFLTSAGGSSFPDPDPPVSSARTLAATSGPSEGPFPWELDSPPPSTSPWRPPLVGPLVVLRGFDPPDQPWLAGHRGVDLLALPGETVRAAGAGVVVYAGALAGRGVVSVRHADGRRTTYEPLEPVVTPGDVVAPGAVLGQLSEVGGHCGSGSLCLHWGLVDGETYLDPLSLLRRGRPVLLPLSP